MDYSDVYFYFTYSLEHMIPSPETLAAMTNIAMIEQWRTEAGNARLYLIGMVVAFVFLSLTIMLRWCNK